jgi:hypothetical protein
MSEQAIAPLHQSKLGSPFASKDLKSCLEQNHPKIPVSYRRGRKKKALNAAVSAQSLITDCPSSKLWSLFPAALESAHFIILADIMDSHQCGYRLTHTRRLTWPEKWEMATAALRIARLGEMGALFRISKYIAIQTPTSSLYATVLRAL